MPSSLWIKSEEHTSELQSHDNLVCRLLLEKEEETCEILSDVVLGGHRLTEHPLGGARLSRTTAPSAGAAVRVCSRTRLCSCLFFLKYRGPPELSPFSPPYGLQL